MKVIYTVSSGCWFILSVSLICLNLDKESSSFDSHNSQIVHGNNQISPNCSLDETTDIYKKYRSCRLNYIY
jgi:hypothetical protein